MIFGVDAEHRAARVPQPQLAIRAACTVRADTLVLIGVLAVECLLLYLLLQKTKVGLASARSASNPESSRLVGVSVGTMLMLGWGLAAALGAIAGSLVIPTTTGADGRVDAVDPRLRVRGGRARRLRQSGRRGRRRPDRRRRQRARRSQYIGVLDGIELVVPFGLILVVLLFRPRACSARSAWSACEPARSVAHPRVVGRRRAASSTSSATGSRSTHDPSDVRLWTQALYVGIAATGLNILTGYNGQVSIGHGAFFGLGAYTTRSSIADHGWSYLPTLPVAMALCFVVGALIGFPALRVKGLYLALVTLGLAVLFPDLTEKFVNGTGGTNLVILNGAAR